MVFIPAKIGASFPSLTHASYRRHEGGERFWSLPHQHACALHTIIFIAPLPEQKYRALHSVLEGEAHSLKLQIEATAGPQRAPKKATPVPSLNDDDEPFVEKLNHPFDGAILLIPIDQCTRSSRA